MKKEQLFDEMKKLRDEGKTIGQIAEVYKITKQYVSYIFRLYNAPLRISMSDEELKELGDVKKIVDKFGVSENHARLRLKQLGFNVPRKKRPRYNKWPKELVEAMYLDYQNGLDQNTIATKYNTSQSVISNLFKFYGFKTNKRGWPDGKPRKYT